MSIKQLRTSLRSWLEERVRIDQWDLDTPANIPTVIDGKRYPANSAVELPVLDLQISKAKGYIEASGKFVYGILFRFNSRASKEQLPIKSVELLTHYLCEQAVRYPTAIWESIISLDVSITDPVKLARVEGENSDWLIVSQLEFDIVFESDAQSDFDNLQPPTPDDPPFVPTEVRVGLNRSLSPTTPEDPSTYTLDRLLEITLEQP